ncbi:MAG: LacI family DNA-binding transcriptional regulator [Ignavibacteriales bacterium]|nr:LacI family DNA-binding transcriptional regulator [Ignavibacteriales bacterium]
MTEKSIRLSDIAEKLNVSTVTVSKALRNHPDISPSTKKLILKTAEELGYMPNFMARNLSSKKSNTIGVIIPKIAHFFFGSIIESIYDTAFKNNYEIILTVSQENAEREKKHIQTLLSMRVDGIIISISQETKDYSIFETVKKKGVPIVFIDRIPNLENINKVYVDDKGGAFCAVEQAIKAGYTKIAHFAGYSSINIGLQRYAGFIEAMKKYKIPINKKWIMQGEFGERSGYDSFMKLYKDNNLPQVIFTVTYPVALGVYKAVNELGLKIPDDIDIICFGNANEQKFLSPPLSCIDQQTELIAEKAITILLDNIQNKENFKMLEYEVPTKLTLRGTCVKK